jgi:hypothetical protein
VTGRPYRMFLRPWAALVIHARTKKDAGPEQSPPEPVSRKDGLGVGGGVQKQIFVGIDVSKARFDIALPPNDESFRVTNNKPGIAALVKRFKKLQSKPCRARGGMQALSSAVRLSSRAG